MTKEDAEKIVYNSVKALMSNPEKHKVSNIYIEARETIGMKAVSQIVTKVKQELGIDVNKEI